MNKLSIYLTIEGNSKRHHLWNVIMEKIRKIFVFWM